MRKRGLKIHLSYESGRLAENYIADAYEKLMPTVKQSVHTIKEESDSEETKKEILNDSSRTIREGFIRKAGTG